MLASLTLCGGLLLSAELAADRLWAADGRDDMATLHEHSERYGWTPRPGSRVQLEGRWTTINAKGYRGPLVTPERAAGVRRIVMLGDSIAFGTHVGDDETFAHLIDAPDGGVEIVNLAVQGYGLDQDLLKLMHEGLGYAPDLVVLNVCVDNDLVDTALPAFLYDSDYPKPFFRVEGDQLVLHSEHLRRSPAERLAAALVRHSSLFAWLASPAKRDHAAAAREEHWTQRRARALLDLKAVETLCFRLVARMDQLAAARGARLLVVLHPNKASFQAGSSWVEAFVAWRPAGIPVTDMRREYRERGMFWEELALDGIGHLSAAGHRAAATILRERLLEESPSQEVSAARQAAEGS